MEKKDSKWAAEMGTRWPGLRHGATVLIVEDEEMVSKLVQLLLVLEGFNVLEAESESEAVEMATGFRGVIDLLLADVRLKEGTGPGVARTLANRFPDLKTAYMSGYPREELIRQGHLRETDAFLPKPFDVAAFRGLIRGRFAQEASCSPAP